MGPPPVTGVHQGNGPDSVVSLNRHRARWLLVAFIALGAGSYLGALSVRAPLVTLYGRINKTLETKPWSPRAKFSAGAQPPVEQ